MSAEDPVNIGLVAGLDEQHLQQLDIDPARHEPQGRTWRRGRFGLRHRRRVAALERILARRKDYLAMGVEAENNAVREHWAGLAGNFRVAMKARHAIERFIDFAAQRDQASVLVAGKPAHRQAMQTNRNGPGVVTALRRGRLFKITARLDGSVLLDEKVVTDVIPAAIFDMPTPHNRNVIMFESVGRAAMQEHTIDLALGSPESHGMPFPYTPIAPFRRLDQIE